MFNSKDIYRWVPTLYFMEGLPFALVTAVSPVLYKNLNYSNSKIAFYSSLFILPWALKWLFAPLLEPFFSKRKLIIGMQALMATALVLLTLSLSQNHFYQSATLFFLIAVFSSIHDMNADGSYIIQLNNKDQAHFIGLRSICYQLGKLLAQGGLITLVGWFITSWGTVQTWELFLGCLTFFIFIFAIYHTLFLPSEKNQLPATGKTIFSGFHDVYKELTALPHWFIIISFTLFYNLPEAQLMKIVPLFLLDTSKHGGLGLTTTTVGVIYETIGTLCILIGITLSGLMVRPSLLKKLLVFTTLFYCFTNVTYLLLSLFVLHSLWLIGSFIAIAQFGFGLTNGVYMFYLLNTFGKGNYPMSLYSIATALMMFSFTLGGAISGYLQSYLGYSYFFIWVIITSFYLLPLTLSKKL